MVLASMATCPGPLGVSRASDAEVPRDSRSPNSVLKVENLRLQEIITKQRKEIEALASGSAPLWQAAARKAEADVALSQVLHVAERNGLCSSSQRQVVMDYVRAGRFDAQHCLDVWSRRVASQSQAAPVSLKDMQGSFSQASTVVDGTARPGAPEADVQKQDNDANRWNDVGGDQTKDEWADAPQELLRRATRTFTPTLRHDSTQRVEPTQVAQVEPTLIIEDASEHPAPTEFGSAWQFAASSSSGVGKQVELAGTALPRLGRPFCVPESIFKGLRGYQREGVAWMARLYAAGKGGILADDMGLGKTVQSLTLLSGLRRAGATHALILLPVSLLDQWATEARKWCPSWPVYTYHGSAAQRERALEAAMQPQGGILLTTYAVLKNEDSGRLLQVEVGSPIDDVQTTRKGNYKRKQQEQDLREDDQPIIASASTELPPCVLPWEGERRPWDIVLCDEAHVMRNISTLLGRRLRDIRARCRLLLTGTPVQNALQDLWALMDFAQPGLLGNHATFVKHFSDPIDKGSVRGASPFAIGLKKHLCEQLWQLVQPHMIRRTKASVGLLGDSGADAQAAPSGAAPTLSAAGQDGTSSGGKEIPLPPKVETVVFLTPTKEQIAAYHKVLEKSEVVQKASDKTKLGFEVFQAIGLLKRLSNHPALGMPFSRKDAWNTFLREASGVSPAISGCRRGRKRQQMEPVEEAPSAGPLAEPQTTDEGLHEEARAGRAAETLLQQLPCDRQSLVAQSSKLSCLAAMLPALAAKGHKTLIFSQGIKMLDLLEHCVLIAKGLKYLRIDGQTDAQTRGERVKQFQQADSQIQCMLLTTSVGGYGLNLTSADRVVILDPAWNPATDLQAVERAHRIGQSREVRVYRFVMSGLMEDKMFRLQVYKMGLAKTALDAEQPRHYFTSNEIRGLFEWCGEGPELKQTYDLLLKKHGAVHDEFAKKCAREDGAEEGWLASAGPQACLSNFSALYTASTARQDSAAAVLFTEGNQHHAPQSQVTDMMKRLGQADDEIKQVAREHQFAQEKLEAAQAALGTIDKEVAGAAVQRTEAQEQLKEAKNDLAQARRAEGQARQNLTKALKVKAVATERLMQLDQNRQQADRVAAAATCTADEVRDQALAAEKACKLAADGVEAGSVSLFLEDGGPAIGSPVVAAATKLKGVRKSLDRIRRALETSRAARHDLEAAEDMAQWSKASEKEAIKLHTASNKAVHRLETSQEVVSKAVASVHEAGSTLVESFAPASGASAAQARSAQQVAKAALKLLSTAWNGAKKSQDSLVKALNTRRTRAQQAKTADQSCQEVEAQLAEIEKDWAAAAASDASRREELDAATAKFSACEASLESAEQHAVYAAKERRQQLRAAVGQAKAEVKAAKVSSRQAADGRKAVVGQFSRAEKAMIGQTGQQVVKLSAAEAISAVEVLRAEAYDANQVEEAYQAKKKQKIDAHADVE